MSKVGLYHLLSSHLPFRKKKGESICSNRYKQVLKERGGLSVQWTCLEFDLPGIILFWQSQTVRKICSVAHNSFSLAAGLCIFSVPLCVSLMPISSLTWDGDCYSERELCCETFFFLACLGLNGDSFSYSSQKLRWPRFKTSAATWVQLSHPAYLTQRYLQRVGFCASIACIGEGGANLLLVHVAWL